MYVRLAFAVAAHLEPEILIVDEVLAVGDAEFQKRCLRKMNDVARSGRSILFVSHNMQAVQSLCTRGVLLSEGTVQEIGTVGEVIGKYLSSDESRTAEHVWPEGSQPGDHSFRLIAMRVKDSHDMPRAHHGSRNDVLVEMEFRVGVPPAGLCIGFDVITEDGAVVFRSYQTDLAESDAPPLRDGRNRWLCRIPAKLLNGGIYWVCPRVGIHNQNWIVKTDPIISFQVTLDHGQSPYWNSLGPGSRPGVIAPIFEWSAQ
jgi:lipopolysaccharide transport system ATP-binding protein